MVLIYRSARVDDIDAVAGLHADSWRRNYRGALSDEFLDGEVFGERLSVWTERLTHPHPNDCTIVADLDGSVAGFDHTVLGEDPTWGALLDNLHVTHDVKGTGIGTGLMAEKARAVIDRAPSQPLYLWVLAQNTAAQAFYDARGGTRVERQSRAPQPGERLRYAWPDPSVLLAP